MANSARLEQLAFVLFALRVVDQLLKASFAFFVEVHEKQETAVSTVLVVTNQRDVTDVLVLHVEAESYDRALRTFTFPPAI